MKKTIFAIMVLLMAPALLYAQSINNTLGEGGTFSIKDGSTTFLTLSQSDGYLDVNNSLTLPATTSSSLGVIFKGADRFIHNYTASGTLGKNTFVGFNAGNFSMSMNVNAWDASYNTGVGYSTLTSLTTGYFNSAFGSSSLRSNSTGIQNTAFGYNSLQGNTSGENNTVMGAAAGYSITTSPRNTAVGSFALFSNTENGENTIMGDHAGYNLTGGSNTAIGLQSLFSATGSNNTAVGWSAGYSITAGTNNTCIGYQADASSATATNEITLGNSSVTTLRCNQPTITSLSDARDKRNIRDLSLGLEFLMSVKPRLYNWDRRDWYTNGKPDGSKMQTAPTAGFIAQELDEVQKKENAEWLNLVLKNNPDKFEATPGNLLPIMVKAIQELKTENDALKKEVGTLRASIIEQVKKEVKAALLKAVQQEDAPTKVSLNDTKN